MGHFLLLVVVALTVGAVVFGVTVLLTGGDGGLSPAEPDGRAVPLPGTRPLSESDVARVRFDVTTRGYRMAQVDQAMRRAAYDIGYKDELINVLEAEVDALRAGRFSDAEVLRRAREAAQAATTSGVAATSGAQDPAEVDQEVATINLGEAGKASPEEPEPVEADQLAGEAGQPATGAERPTGADTDGTEDLPGPRADADGTEEPAGQHAKSGGGGSDESEPNSIMPGHR